MGKWTCWVRTVMNINELVWIGGGQNFDRCGTLGFGWMRMNIGRIFKLQLELWLMTSSIFESIKLSTGLFPKKPGTNENLRRTNLLINIHDWANPTSLFPRPSFFPHFDFAGAWALACWWMSGNRLVASLQNKGSIYCTYTRIGRQLEELE